MTRHALASTVAVIAAYKSVENLAIFGPLAWVLVGAPLLLGAVWTTIRERAGMMVIAAGALLANLTPAYRNHLVLLFWIALTLALLRDEALERLALRWTLSIMYGFAAVAKLWPDWLTGEALLARTWSAPLLPEPLLLAVVWGTVLVEGGLAYGVWSRWPGWWRIALLLHLGFVLFTQTSPWDIGRLIVFGVLAVAVWWRASLAVSRPSSGSAPAVA